MRVENYAVTGISVLDNYQNLVSDAAIETAIIDPTRMGTIMQIFVQPAYANVVSASIKTSLEPVASLGGKQVGLLFKQYYWVENSNKYVTLIDSNGYVQEGDTLQLSTTYPGYNGVIYVHVQIEKFSGAEVDFEVLVNVTTGDGEEKEFTKYLTTSYLPGVNLSYDGFKQGDKNLVQVGTYGNVATVQLHGYQFNSNPHPTIVWNLTGVTGYAYVEEDGVVNRSIIKEIDDANNNDIIGETYLIGDYITAYLKSDYKDVVFDVSTQSYLMDIYFNVLPNTPAPFELTVSLDLLSKTNEIVTESDRLTFNPADFLLKGVSLKDIEGNKNLVIGTSTSLEFNFVTNNTAYDYSNEIYTRLLQNIEVIELGTPIKLLNSNNLSNLFYYYANSQEIHLSTEENVHTGFDVEVININDGENFVLSLYGVSNFNNTIHLRVNFTYVLDETTGKYKLLFEKSPSSYYFEFNFNLNVISATTDGTAFPIYDANDFLNKMTDNSYNILMNDIELVNFNPIETPIASLDGNNKVIKIKSFARDLDRTNYGLFAQLGTYQDADGVTHQSILKNVTVDYSECEDIFFTNINLTNVTFGGLVGVNNGGLIYNCEVINYQAGTDNSINILLDDKENVNFVFGGLVGENKNSGNFAGAITNSRVGTESFTRITANSTTESTRTKDNGTLKFVLGNENSKTNAFKVTAGAFVGINTGVISNSYVKNTSLINYSTNETENRTAGFVGENGSGGQISYSFVKAKETTTTNNAYSTGRVIEHKGNGSVAGFVHVNIGTITNTYANLELATKSAYLSGFVFENRAGGTISESYSACTMNSGLPDSYTYAEQPFVGVDNAGNLLSNGKMENVYYLTDNNVKATVDGTKPQATGLDASNFADSNNLNGFVFVLSDTKAEREQSIWSYYDTNNKKQMLPVLIGAETIAYSYRYLKDITNTENKYANAVSYELGTKNNPYTISNVEEFNSAFTKHNAKYVRFINNIDFAENETAIETRTKDLGSDNYVTSIEGNGMNISGIIFDTGTSVLDKVGLFASIKNAYIKNLKLNFATPEGGKFSTTGAKFSGGLAGIITNSVIIDVKLNGANTTLTGYNFVGGLAGLINGTSLIYNIDTNLSVKAGSPGTLVFHDYEYYKNYMFAGDNTDNDLVEENYYAELKHSADNGKESYSYAGGIAGAIDLEFRDETKTSKANQYNIAYININGNEMVKI